MDQSQVHLPNDRPDVQSFVELLYLPQERLLQERLLLLQRVARQLLLLQEQLLQEQLLQEQLLQERLLQERQLQQELALQEHSRLFQSSAPQSQGLCAMLIADGLPPTGED